MRLIDESSDLASSFQRNGGWFSGHTVFRNGSHGDGWLEKGAIIRNTLLLDSVAKRQANGIRSQFPEAELLIGSGECGPIVAAAVARYLKLPLAITVEEGKNLYFHRMHVPAAGRRAVLVDDLIFSGTDVRRHIDLLGTMGIEFLGVSVWVNHQGERMDGVPIHSLMAPPFSVYSEADCPLCRTGVPLAYTEVRE